MDSQENAVFYDIDHLRKMSVGKSVETSPLRYSIIRSKAPRFVDSSTNTPFGIYKTDTAHRKNTESASRDSRQFYAGCFESNVPRFGRAQSVPSGTDVFYDVDRLKNCKANSIGVGVETTPIQYAIHRSRYKRFQEKNKSEAADVIYDTDYGTKQSLFTSMQQSPIQYKIVATLTDDAKFGHKKSPDFRSSLSPGMYDYKITADISVSPALDNRPLSSLMSCSGRFGREPFTGFGLGSTYRPENDARKWLAKDCTISKSVYLRPQYMPKSLKGLENSGKSKKSTV